MIAVKCKEGDRVVTRYIQRMQPDVADALSVYDNARQVSNMFGKMDEQALTFLVGNAEWFWKVDDVGLICVSPLGSMPHTAHVHITFWDKRLRGREEICRELARRVTAECHYHTFWTAIPREARTVLAFAKRVGFQVHSEDAKRLVLSASADVFTMKSPELRS